MVDYYMILNVKREASLEEIRKAYYFLARRYHPDNAGAEAREMFETVRKAHEVLSDPKKREEYDHSLRSVRRANGRAVKNRKVDNYFGTVSDTFEPEKINRFFDSFPDVGKPENYRSLFRPVRGAVSPAEHIYWPKNDRNGK